MSKLLVTHINPDADAITSVWLFRRFHPEFTDAGIAFVFPGSSYEDQTADSDPNIVHVDTGMGEFDHHQSDDYTCAAKKVLEHLQMKFEYLRDDEALERLVEVVVEGDHFGNCYWPEAASDRYEFMFDQILNGLKQNNTITDHGMVDLGCTCLDGIYIGFKNKIEAEKEIEAGRKFDSKWGKGVVMSTKNNDVLQLAQKMGYVVVGSKNPDVGMVKIKAQPRSEVDLTQVYEKVREQDPEASWFLHASKKMLLNGIYRNPESVFSKLSVEELVKVLS